MGSTVVRCVTLPVAVPLGEDADGKPWTWQSFNVKLNEAFRASTDLANWAVHTLYKRDTPGAKEPPEVRERSASNPKGCYLYQEAAESFPGWAERWAGAKSNAQCVLRAVHGKYRTDRFRIMQRMESSLIHYRYPYPYPVHNQNWKTGYAPGDFPTVSIALPGAGQVELRLKRDGGFRRQLAMFRDIHARAPDDEQLKARAKGEKLPYERGEAALYRSKTGQLMLKMVGHFPRRERGAATNVCFLHTDPKALLVAEVNGRSVTVTNGDHLKRAHAVIKDAAARHRVFLQRASEDKKREVRMDRDMRRNLNGVLNDRCLKQQNRIDTAVKQIAAQVARFCERQGVGTLAYDDSVKSFLPDGFAWHALKTRLQQIFAGEMGGEWIDGEGYVSGHTHEEMVEWLQKARATAAAGTKAVANARRKGSHPAVTAGPKSKH